MAYRVTGDLHFLGFDHTATAVYSAPTPTDARDAFTQAHRNKRLSELSNAPTDAPQNAKVLSIRNVRIETTEEAALETDQASNPISEDIPDMDDIEVQPAESRRYSDDEELDHAIEGQRRGLDGEFKVTGHEAIPTKPFRWSRVPTIYPRTDMITGEPVVDDDL